jgi:biopolymer transport protein ExbD
MNFLDNGGVSFYKNFAPQKSAAAEINITSLIDVIFMLVVFFMIGASFEKPSIALSLPKATAGERNEKPLLTVSVDSGGAVYVAGEKIAIESLPERIAAAGAPGNVTVALECDGAAAFDKVVAVMDSVKNAGVRNVAIRHEPK